MVFSKKNLMTSSYSWNFEPQMQVLILVPNTLRLAQVAILFFFNLNLYRKPPKTWVSMQLIVNLPLILINSFSQLYQIFSKIVKKNLSCKCNI